MSNPTPQPGILQITPYKGGESEVTGVETVRKLSSNESPLGPSPRAIKAAQQAVAEVHRYPDGASAELTAEIGKLYGIPAENIICGAGSDELISLLVQAYAGPGDEVLYSQHGFMMYPISAMSNGATPVKAPEVDLTTDPEALLAAVTDRTRIVFIANPNNPTGTYITADALADFRARLRDDIILVVDAAYAEYVSRNDYSAGLELVSSHDNVVMLRTFSKIHGLAGMRLGWGYMPAGIIEVLHRTRGPFNVGLVSQIAGAESIRDTAHIDAARTHNDIWLPKVRDALIAAGLDVPESVGNFLLARFPGGAEEADRANAYLMSRGIIVRAMGGYGLAESLRITIGTEEDNLAVIEAIQAFRKNP